MPAIFFSSTLSGCVNLGSSVDKLKVEIPPLPSHVRNAGNVTSWPQDINKDNVRPLLVDVRKNELKQARAVRSCVMSHDKLELLYGGKK